MRPLLGHDLITFSRVSQSNRVHSPTDQQPSVAWPFAYSQNRGVQDLDDYGSMM